MNALLPLLLAAAVISQAAPANGDVRIEVQADRILGRVPPLLAGACIEDVNHEIYGGLYSQMLFGEAFQEPPLSCAPAGFRAYGGQWKIRGDELHFAGAPGDKLVADGPYLADGEVGVDIFLGVRESSNVGLIVRVANAGAGVDRFDAYEIALSAARQQLRLGRHRQNWEPIRDVSCVLPVGEWIALTIKLSGGTLEAFVNGRSVLRHDDGTNALARGSVGLRAFQSEARYRNLWVSDGSKRTALTFSSSGCDTGTVSGMWRQCQRGTAEGAWLLEKKHPFGGSQCQRLSFLRGQGEVGIENQGLNRWGLNFSGGRKYEGLLWARADAATEVWVSAESSDGATVLAEKRIRVRAGDWQRLEFSFEPKATELKGRFSIKLKQPGSVELAYAFLQSGAWGRFKGLPVRRDVAEALIDQGLTLLRYGGSMVNEPDYRWKKMVGPRDRRPPYRGHWYAHSSNGWDIPDFMNFCEAAGFEYVPDFSIDESPQDMADFIDYAKGSTKTDWGRRRAADGHAKPYRLGYLELGNEERVDENYATKFEALAKTIWAKDPGLILIVGDFAYSRPISDPMRIQGAHSGITNLAGQQRILQIAKRYNREVWFDLHVGTEGPRPDETLAGMFSFADALERIADGARQKVLVFELNANNHSQRRALGNALALQAIERDGRIPIVASANCLQPDGQNENGWDQGLLFLDPAHVWLQPPGYVTQMRSRNYLPRLVACNVSGAEATLDVNATCSDDGKTLVLAVVNTSAIGVTAQLNLRGFTPKRPSAQVTELAGPLDSVNTAHEREHIVPSHASWKHKIRNGTTARAFPAHSFTVLRFQ